MADEPIRLEDYGLKLEPTFVKKKDGTLQIVEVSIVPDGPTIGPIFAEEFDSILRRLWQLWPVAPNVLPGGTTKSTTTSIIPVEKDD